MLCAFDYQMKAIPCMNGEQHTFGHATNLPQQHRVWSTETEQQIAIKQDLWQADQGV